MSTENVELILDLLNKKHITREQAVKLLSVPEVTPPVPPHP